MLEKILLCYRKQEEMLRFQIQNLEIKIEDIDKASDEKLNYEIKLIEVHQQEQKNKFSTIIETKDQELSLLKTENKKIESKLQSFQKRFKEEMVKYKSNIAESKHITEMRYKEIFDEKEKALQESARIQNQCNAISLENKNLRNDLINLKGKFEEEVQMNNKELNSLLEKCKRESKSSIKNLETQLKQKENECAVLKNNIIDLKNKLKSIPMEVEIKTRENEKKQYDKEINSVNELIRNHKYVIQNANLELQQKDKIISEFYYNVEILDKDIATLKAANQKLKDENQQLETTLALRDSRIIDLQLRVTELKEKLNTHGEQVSNNFKALENAQKLNFSFQRKIEYFEKEKVNLEHSNDTLKQQNESLQQETDKLLNAMIMKDSEVEAINKKLKTISKKLKEKNDALISHQQKYEMNSQTIGNLQESNTELQKTCKELMNKNTELSKTLNMLEEEKFSLEVISAEQEGIKDREISNLLNRLSGSEADLLKLKKVLKVIKMKDSTGKYE